MKTTTSIFLLLGLLPTLAHAHPGHGADFVSGVAHPMMGLDHVLAMIAVGVWAAQLGGRARWAMPIAFVGTMIFGGMLALAGLSVPFVEPVILASVMVVGLLIATAVRLPLVAAMSLAGVFALFHGAAHGSEMPVTASSIVHIGGFALATVALHVLGLGFGSMIRTAEAPLLRYSGAVIALCGMIVALA